MSSKVISSEADVNSFLCILSEVLCDQNFKLSTDLDILMTKKGESQQDPYSTANTLLSLDYDSSDVRRELLNLDSSAYLETFIDDKDSTLPPFYAFVKEIDGRMVYIKVKIRDRSKCKVFCVSFHFAKYPVPTRLPYAKI